MIDVEGEDLVVCPDVDIIATGEGVTVSGEVCESPESGAGGLEEGFDMDADCAAF